MDYDHLMQLMTQKRQDIGQRFAPEARMAHEDKIRGMLFGGDQTLSSLRGNEAGKVKELYEFDKGLAVAQQSGPAGFIDDPASAAKYGSVQLQNRAGELSDIQRGIANRRDVLGDALEKALKMMNYGLEAAKLEYAGMQDELDNKLKIDEFQLRKSESGRKGSTEADKRAQGATDEALAAMQEAISAELAKNPSADTKSLIWKWINANEPYFGSQGVNASALWDVYAKTPGRKAAPVEEEDTGGGFNFLKLLTDSGAVGMNKQSIPLGTSGAMGASYNSQLPMYLQSLFKK